MTVKLLHNSPLWLASHAIRMSHNNHDKSDSQGVCSVCGDYYESGFVDNYCSECGVSMPMISTGTKDRELIARVGNKLKHKSVLEMLVYWFDIDGISRACLQELARHRTARLTVKSSRYTLKELKDNCSFYNTSPTGIEWRWDEVEKFCVLTGHTDVDASIARALSALQNTLEDGSSNDIAKYCLPEAFKTRLQWQIDMRNYQSFLELRLDKSALWEIRELAYATYKALPPEHRYLVNDIIVDKGYEVC